MMHLGPFDDDSDFKAYKYRLETFQNAWPFTEDCSCTPEKMAEAGFYLVGNSSEPDLVRCYYCRRELDGWEPTDVPWEEHKRRGCPFISLGKLAQDLTIEDVFHLEAERKCCILRKAAKDVEEKFRSNLAEEKAKIVELGVVRNKRGGGRRKKKI